MIYNYQYWFVGGLLVEPGHERRGRFHQNELSLPLTSLLASPFCPVLLAQSFGARFDLGVAPPARFHPLGVSLSE